MANDRLIFIESETRRLRAEAAKLCDQIMALEREREEMAIRGLQNAVSEKDEFMEDFHRCRGGKR